MQFEPATFAAYDLPVLPGRRPAEPLRPADAVYAAARLPVRRRGGRGRRHLSAPCSPTTTRAAYVARGAGPGAGYCGQPAPPLGRGRRRRRAVAVAWALAGRHALRLGRREAPGSGSTVRAWSRRPTGSRASTCPGWPRTSSTPARGSPPGHPAPGDLVFFGGGPSCGRPRRPLRGSPRTAPTDGRRGRTAGAEVRDGPSFAGRAPFGGLAFVGGPALRPTTLDDRGVEDARSEGSVGPAPQAPVRRRPAPRSRHPGRTGPGPRRRLQHRRPPPGHRLAELHAPLVERVDPPDGAFDEDGVLVEGHQLARGSGGEFGGDDRRAGRLPGMTLSATSAGGVPSAAISSAVLPKASALSGPGSWP